MITSNVPSSSGSTQTTATSCDQFSSFTNQPSSRYPIPPNLLPYYPLNPAFFLPIQQHVLPPTHPQGYLTTHAHAPSEFPYPPPTHPVQQYSILPSHTNTPIIHQNPSLSYEQQHLSPLTGGPPHLYHHRLSNQPFSLYSSTDPNSVTIATATATAHHSLNPPDASPSTPAHQHPLSPTMQRYVTYLKNSYKNILTTPVYDKEHSLLQVKAKSFINIALVHKHSPQYLKDSVRNEMIMDRLHGHVDAIQEKKTKLFICDVCKTQDGRLARSVLVEGAPGVGKTTFAYELCKRWAKGEIMWEWAAVVLIKLRDHTTRTAQTLNDLLYHPRPEVQQSVVDELVD